jgi:SnoaL-like domain
MMEHPFRGEDREAIRELIAAYAHYYDDGRLAEFADLFVEDGVMQLGPGGALAHGPTEIERALSSVETPDLRHFTTDVMIEFTGETRAKGVCRFAVHSPVRDFDGTYDDEYVKSADGWRFARRTISVFGDFA